MLKNGILNVCAAIAACALAAPAMAQNGGLGAADFVKDITLQGSGPHTGEVAVPDGKSMIIRFNRPVREVLVGDPEIADIIPLTDRTIYVLGQEIGGTNITLFGDRKELLGILDLQVTYDILNLKKRLYEMMPNENIEVRTSGDSILLSGSAKDSGVASRAALLAQNYAPEKVVNMIDIGASQQVMLAVRFAEIERTAAKELGISPQAFFQGDDGTIGALATSFINPTSTIGSSFAAARGSFDVGDVSIDLFLDALEERGIASILAEPTLIAISGESASFLAGGEFPVPVQSQAPTANGFQQIQIEFKEFGVRLSFTPTVLGENISLLVEPEVSELDPTSGVSTGGVAIPGLRTRRASTTVQLKNGQSFAIAGLIQKQFIDELRQLPGGGSIPIIGALMRSARYERAETELAIIITPYLVEPSDPGELRTPYEDFIRPHELELFFLGKLEGNQPFDFAPRRKYFDQSNTTGPSGIDGEVGYILE